MKRSLGSIFSGIFLIAGTAIGAGMLGIPLVTSQAGFFPGVVITVGVWFFMLLTGFLFLEVTLKMPDGSNILSMSQRYLGRKGKYVSGAMFLFLYYSLLIAYFAAGAPLLGKALSTLFGYTFSFLQNMVIFGLIFGTIVAISPRSIDRVNFIFTCSMIGSWLVLVGRGGEIVQLPFLYRTNWSMMLFATPILFSAFGYHNIIPSLSTYLLRRKKVLYFSIFFGTLLPLIVYLFWQWVIIGAIPPFEIEKAMQQGQPITETFSSISGYPWFVHLGRFFAFFAIFTSILGVSFSMVDFLGDGFGIRERRGLKRIWLTLLTFIPPFLAASLNPDIFDLALGVAGGFGEAFLNGLLPVLLVYFANKTQTQSFWKKGYLFLLGTLSICVAILEIYHLTHG